MMQKRSEDFSDDDLRTIFNDPTLSKKIRNTSVVLWEQLERRALRQGVILQLFLGEPTPKKRVASWEDPHFLGF
jgi:hypothetical protein